MVMVAGAWYSNAIFWSALAVVVAVGAACLTAWATLRAASPKIRLTYDVRSTVDLLPGHLNLAVLHGGVALATPHVVVFDLANQGRRDIEDDMFPNGAALEFSFGRPVVSILGSTTVRGTAATPILELDMAGRATLAPTHIPKGQVVSYTLLFDGPVEELSATGSLLNGSLRKALVLPGEIGAIIRDIGAPKAFSYGILIMSLTALWISFLIAFLLPDSYIDWLQN
ncbi:hypothetical protein [Streptomyces sp. NPDC003023]|uniref:hypothetical protein n=1 Tax=Streptomyces sp. NPDC003023 TaxID=3364675 RepID=UPI0036A8559F